MEYGAQNTLSTSPHGTATRSPDRGTLRLASTALSRPWHWATSGLPCPCEASDRFPVLLDFSGGTFHTRRTHEYEDSSARRARMGNTAIIPDIHWSVQNRAPPQGGSCRPRVRCRGRVRPLEAPVLGRSCAVFLTRRAGYASVAKRG
jgi:hypothetical protein